MTDMGEKLFHGWLNFRNSLAAKFQSPSQTRVSLADERERLQTFGVLLSGRAVEVKGGDILDASKEFAILPDSIDLLPSIELNAALLRYRLLYVLTAENLGITCPASYSREERLLFTLLSVSKVTAAIDAEYEKARELRSVLSGSLISGASSQKTPKTRADLLTLCTERLLGRKLEAINSQTDRLIGRICSPEAGAALSAVFAECWKSLIALYPRPGILSGGSWVLWGIPSPTERDTTTGTAPVTGQAAGGQAKVITLDRTIHAKLQDPTKQKGAPLFHSFEKTETAEDYLGEQGDAQAADVVYEEEALKELQFSAVVRTPDQTPGLVKADMVIDGAALEVADENAAETPLTYRYPEWHYRRSVYRQDWCTVYERPPAPAASENPSSVIEAILRRNQHAVNDIRREYLRILATREVRTRQLDGPDIDLEAIVERHADLRANRTPLSRLYLSQRKALQDVALQLLFDTSLSTDSWVEGRRVLDVEVEAMAILSGAFEGYLDDEVAIAHFNSRTRNECNYSVLKRFGESWSGLRKILPTLQPYGYTRIGPAVRHAAETLKGVSARRKVLLLITDGKPTDYDQYEGRYGIEDVAQAIREAKQHRISTFALTIDHEARHYMAQMVGTGHFRILPRASLLPQSMAEFFLKAVA